MTAFLSAFGEGRGRNIMIIFFMEIIDVLH